MGAVTNLNGLTDAKYVCAGRELSFVIDNNGKLRAAHRTYATEYSVVDVHVKFKSVVNYYYDENCVGCVIDENDDLWSVKKPTPGLCPNRAFLFTDVTTKPKLQLKKVKLGLKVKNISSNGFKVTCVSPEGKLYLWSTAIEIDSRETKPTQIHTPEEVTQVSLGTDHLLTLGISGTVYSSGKNNLGQLGRLGNSWKNSLHDMDKVKFLREEIIVQIAASGPHSVALTAGGLVYVWGQDLPTQRIIKRPTCVDLFFDNQILVRSISLSGGCKYGAVNENQEPYKPYILALTEDNKVYAWGKGSMGQCGTKNMSRIGFSFSEHFFRMAPMFGYYIYLKFP